MSVINSPIPPMAPLAVNEAEAGRLLNLSPSTIYNLRKQGRLGSVKLGEGKKSRVLFPVESLRRFLDSNIEK
jgi:excisionase family DNA binding protein